MPLRALANGEDVMAWNLNKKVRDENYRCPICEDKMIPVIPEKNIIKHFRHKNNEIHKPETKEHLRGKRKLYKIIKKYYQEYDDISQPRLECKIGKKIADVLVEDRFALEFQCSPISISEMLEREENAKDFDLNVKWIMGGKFLKNKDGVYDYITSPEIHAGSIGEECITPPYYFDGEKIIEMEFKRKYAHGGGYCDKKGWFGTKNIYHQDKKIFSLLCFDGIGINICWDNFDHPKTEEMVKFIEDEEVSLEDFL